MRSGSQLLWVAVAVAAAGCGSNSKPKAFQVVQGDNVVEVTVGATCGTLRSYVNEPCVSVKVCAPGSTTSCQKVDGLLLDTGSFGLRIFKEALPLTLPAVAAPNGGSLAECVKYADLSADWGPVVTADVVLANEPPVRVPIQVIDATYGTVPGSCQGAETFSTAAFNGILGVGVFIEDCGPTCPVDAGQYFAVDGTNVTTVAVAASSQVQNPVGLLPGDNNGIILALPSVPASGAPSVTGSLVLGIGTRSNNIPTSASALSLTLDGAGNFTTTLDGGPAMTGSFVDSGSNGLFFAPPSGSSIAPCTASRGWYCPSSPLSFGATNAPSAGYTGNRLRASFQLASVDALSGSNSVFSNIGGQAVQGGGFDWGLPFFLGRTVYLGYLGRPSPFGNGPTLAY